MRLDPLVAPVFVVLWSTGFIGAKLGLPHAEPMTFLAIRFAAVAALLALWVQAAGAPWPTWREVRDQALIGALLHFYYLGGVFVGISLGVEAGTTALIVGLQPVLTALIAYRFLGERMVAVQWIGIAAGLAGVILVVLRKMDAGLGDPLGVFFCVMGLLGISVGSILQKSRAADTPMRGGNTVQFATASVCCFLCALIFEDRTVEWAPAFIIALGWSILPLSIGAITLLYVLIKRGAASNVASLFFLVPPCTALFAWALFDEVLGPVEIFGMALAAFGVLLVNRPGIVSALIKAR
ncbi:MAG: EamA family transporter [Pseudomonadota bacterium]